MNIAIIVAAGRGTRFGAGLSKQYLPIAGKPLLCHTLDKFCACDAVNAIVLVVAAPEMEYCKTHILSHMAPTHGIRLAAGGDQRQDSVLKGLAAAGAADDDVALIHDGVRPFVTHELIRACVAGLADADGCMAAIPASDTLAAVTPEYDVDRIIDRDGVWLAQTPQVFRFRTIMEAHRQAAAQGWRVT
ncbi:MAG: IspD/TarI family cytidylyltransferase, partial [Thermodesulfobacteriota bacterium]